jgi:membrane protein DedA with SNARE-associated domain
MTELLHEGRQLDDVDERRNQSIQGQDRKSTDSAGRWGHVTGLGAAIAQQGQRLVFLNVFLQQIGVPVPAEPTLVAAGSLAARGRLSIPGVAVAALVATLAADLTWFAVGKRYGRRALHLVFRLSPSPSKYLDQTERLFSRWGPVAFALAKFIPGMPMAGPVLAGGMGTALRVFLIYDLLAMGLWASVFTGLGVLFQRDVDRALRGLDRFGGWGLLFGAVIVAFWVLRRWHRSVADRLVRSFRLCVRFKRDRQHDPR